MDFVGLSGRENDKVSSFSHGMRQRLGLAQCLLHDPDLVVLDEPGTGLDPQGLVDMREMIQNLHREQGKTILLSSHHLSEVEAVATDLVVVDRGRCVVQGSAKALLSQSERQIRITVGRADEALALLNAGPWAGRGRLNNRGELTGALGREEVPSAVQFLTQNGFEVYAIESRQKLEDYYMNLLNHHPTES
jgi:ABC-type multidrug transport system ATPase subunit